MPPHLDQTKEVWLVMKEYDREPAGLPRVDAAAAPQLLVEELPQDGPGSLEESSVTKELLVDEP